MNKFLKRCILKTISWTPCKFYISVDYRLSTGQKLDWANLRTYNEKIQLLKLHDRREIYKKYVDKYEVYDFVREKLGDEYLIPLITVHNKVAEIDWAVLPDQFVIQTTHGSGGTIVCKDKSTFNIKAAKKRIRKHLRKKYHGKHREMQYKGIKPRIIIKRYVENKDGSPIKDYKFMCFHGVPHCIEVHSSYLKDNTSTFYNTKWENLNVSVNYPLATSEFEKPANFEKMMEIATQLSTNMDMPFVRIDLYNVDGLIYFGEITLHHWAGLGKWKPETYNKELGDLINLKTLGYGSAKNEEAHKNIVG